ncbi:hypothetical protein [Pseudoduganella chitinolytica]|uniref:PepSY domain-containing protein n=1 Tax=Pseudoduganella chitinolytica TaxID=34070 RepID=A0ABY8BBB5_9BURK|nr:hypothetical protein [Pseudoduganella chitinolytica]WEF32996.1 hypothetical protein PX653_27000 [Pseudoduganella chitinolytica]
MKRSISSMSAWTAALLLCAGASQATHATPGRWAALTPLLAGTYGGKSGGSCAAQPATEGGATGALQVKANGKVQAPGIDIDVADSAIANIERRTTAAGIATSVALVAADQKTSLAVGRVSGMALAQARAGEQSFNCEGVRLPTALDKQALVLTLAGSLDTAGTIECSATPDEKPHPHPFALARGRATLGEHTLDLAAATDELVTRGPDGILKYHANLRDGRAFIAYYDEGGKVRNVVILDRGKDVLGCGPDE